MLSTLATKADLAELALQFEALRGERREQNAELRVEIQVGQELLRKEMEQLRTEMERFSNRLLGWMIATTLSLIITFTALFVGTSNFLIARLAPLASPAVAVSLDDHNRSPSE